MQSEFGMYCPTDVYGWAQSNFYVTKGTQKKYDALTEKSRRNSFNSIGAASNTVQHKRLKLT